MAVFIKSNEVGQDPAGGQRLGRPISSRVIQWKSGSWRDKPTWLMKEMASGREPMYPDHSGSRWISSIRLDLPPPGPPVLNLT